MVTSEMRKDLLHCWDPGRNARCLPRRVSDQSRVNTEYLPSPLPLSLVKAMDIDIALLTKRTRTCHPIVCGLSPILANTQPQRCIWVRVAQHGPLTANYSRWLLCKSGAGLATLIASSQPF